MSQKRPRIQLAHLPRELKAAYPNDPAAASVTYRAAYNKVLNGEIPAEQASPRGPRTLDPEHVPAIAASFGVEVATPSNTEAAAT